MAPFFLHAVAPKDLLDLGSGDRDTTSRQSLGDVSSIEPNHRTVDDLGEHVDDRGRIEVSVHLLGRGTRTDLRAARNLCRCSLLIGADVEEELLDHHAAHLSLLDEVKQAVVDS